MKILKFGGSSVATSAAIRAVTKILHGTVQRKDRVAVVCSAFQGVTDALIELARVAVRGDAAEAEARLEALRRRHLQVAAELLPELQVGTISRQVQVLFRELEDLLRGVTLLRELSPASLDGVMSFGERLSNTIIAESLRRSGLPACYADARAFIRTDQRFGRAGVDRDATDRLVEAYFSAAAGLPVITGFIGATESGQTTTLGRGGSDYTAALIAAALRAAELEIWTDVDGVLTADPRKVPGARSIGHLSYEEAMEMSHFGAKVIYPPTLQPAFDRGVPIRIRNTFHPEFEGTVISAGNPPIRRAIKGISSIDHVALLRVQGSGMVGVAGISGRLFRALAQAGVNVILITQGSSEHTISLAVEPDRAEEARRAVEEEFALEIEARRVYPVKVEPELSIVAVVGENMRRTPGIAGVIFSALGREQVNVVAIAQGSSELNVSIVVSRADEGRALRCIHDAFFQDDSGERVAELYQVGTGVVGGALLEQIARHKDALRREHALELRVCGVANSKRMRLDRRGLDWDENGELWDNGAQPADLTGFLAAAAASPCASRIVVDCTPGRDVAQHYLRLLDAGLCIVTPNKQSNAADLGFYRRLHEGSAGRFLYETTVGAGLPVISTLQNLLSSGDEILSIEAVLSGSVNFILNQVNAGTSFSAAVAEARRQRYTEPDPRDDLDGMDMARKMLILARETGLSLELADVAVESVLPELDRGVPLEDFLATLPRMDEAWRARREQAAQLGQVLRYLGRLSRGEARVGLQAVGPDSPFHHLPGSENMVIFRTLRYRESPLVVRGPGAGPEVTAAGVFADVIRLARRNGRS